MKFVIFAGTHQQAKTLMREMDLMPNQVIIVTHQDDLDRLAGLEHMVGLLYGTWADKLSYQEVKLHVKLRRGTLWELA